ncbi:MAG: hypothetical protein HWN66_17430 [Candidatus Helarchaeota archaeon]|nr:hypothetical protein [Candidatus Helarchaeota archaeon]
MAIPKFEVGIEPRVAEEVEEVRLEDLGPEELEEYLSQFITMGVEIDTGAKEQKKELKGERDRILFSLIRPLFENFLNESVPFFLRSDGDSRIMSEEKQQEKKVYVKPEIQEKSSLDEKFSTEGFDIGF